MRGIAQPADRTNKKAGRPLPQARGTRTSSLYGPDQPRRQPRKKVTVVGEAPRPTRGQRAAAAKAGRKAVAWRKAWGPPPPDVAKAMVAQGRAVPGATRVPGANEGFMPGLRSSAPELPTRTGMQPRRGLRQSWSGAESKQEHGQPTAGYAHFPPHGLPPGAGPCGGSRMPGGDGTATGGRLGGAGAGHQGASHENSRRSKFFAHIATVA